MDILDRQLRHQVRLVDDLLNVTRIVRGKISLRRQPLDLVALVRDTVEDQRSAIGEAGLSLTLELPEEPVVVHGDPARLAQILDNLLQNAIKFTDSGGHVTVTVMHHASCVVRPDTRHTTHDTRHTPHDWASVSVRDTGIGIAPEMLPYVFDTFAQADRSLDRSRGGLGLGLALVKGLLGLHGGEVRAFSEGPGRGAEFTFLLPLDGAPAPNGAAEAPISAHQNSPSKIAASESAARRVLIIEDNQDAAETLSELLEQAGHVVMTALTGLDGVASAHLVAVTGYGQEEDRQHAREAGFDLHVTKPVDLADLWRLLAAMPVRG
jgi:hypothetical protein